MSGTGKSVLIIGCGIAGPVLAMLLKHKGFDPVIYERQPEIQPAGIALAISPQSFKVLHILGLAEQVIALGCPIEKTHTYSQLRNELLVQTDGGTRLRAWLGWPLLMISRAEYHQFLYNSTKKRGIDIYLGKKLVDVKQDGERVKASFDNGTEAEGDLLMGCDGLHSAVRDIAFGKEEATYTRLIQIGGIGPIPEFYKSPTPGVYHFFGDGDHFFCVPVSSTQMVWVNTLPEPVEAKEDWRRVSIDKAREMIQGLQAAEWEHGPKEVIAGATFVTKYGLYERPILDVWHKGRIVLVGDAAHPTSPHLGQGANQALEDCYHLVCVLCKAAPLTDASLDGAFKEYESIRIPIVTKAVDQAKKEGQTRVVSGREACEARDERLVAGEGTDPERRKFQAELMQGPFMGQSEI